MHDHSVRHNCKGFEAYFAPTMVGALRVGQPYEAFCNCSLATTLLSLMPLQIREWEKPNFR